MHVSGITDLADYFVVCSAESARQVRAIAEAVDGAMGESPLGIEGLEASQWVLMDYNDVILHIFRKETREFYDLERLWGDVPRLKLTRPRKQEETAISGPRTGRAERG